MRYKLTSKLGGKMTAWGLLLPFILFAAAAFAGAEKRNSARRPLGESYLNYAERAHILENQQISADAYALAQPYKKATLPPVTSWDAQTLATQFVQLRDVRWMTTDEHPGFLRRSSWLYPDDGCYARAALAVMNLIHWKVPAPNKIFVFGDLALATHNSPDGKVGWWYHVAPIVEVAGKKFVLDPSVDPLQPLELEKWLRKMHDDIGELSVAICHSGTYGPNDACDKDSDGSEMTAQSDQIGFLEEEWTRLLDLKRDPTKELGEKPPWTRIGKAQF